MPKKKKGKKGKGAASLSATAVDSDASLKAARDKLEMQLDVKCTQLMNLQEEYQRAQDLIASLERKLRKETGALKEQLQLKGSESLGRVEDLEFQVKSQKETIKLYESQLHAAEVVVGENEVLRNRVSNLNNILQSQSKEHAQIVHNLNSDRFNIRLQLEQAFRKALVEAKEKSQEDALEAMTEESKKAIQLNRELTAELEAQSQGIRKMCEHFDMRDDQLKSVRLESRLNQSQIEAMTGELTSLARAIQKQKMEMQAKDEEIAEKERERLAAEVRAQKIQSEAEGYQRSLQEKEKYIKNMQARIYFLSEKLTKALTRRGGKSHGSVRKVRSSRQLQLLRERQNADQPASPARAQSSGGSRLVSNTFEQDMNRSPETFSGNDADSPGGSESFDPAYIWNAELRDMGNLSSSWSPTSRSPRLLEVGLPNKDPRRLDGTRSNRTHRTSTQFAP